MSPIIPSVPYYSSKPFPQDYRRPPDAEEQLEEELIKTYIMLMNKGYSADQIALGFIDEASPQTSANTVRFWSFGNSPIIKNTTKYKANAIGFYAINGHSVKDFIPDSSQESIEAFLTKVRNANRDFQAVVVILDRYSSHRAKTVRNAAESCNIVLVHLPAYSPDLNPIEFIWKTIKRAISRNFVHSLSDMRRIITDAWEGAVGTHSYAKNWIETFVPSIITYGG